MRTKRAAVWTKDSPTPAQLSEFFDQVGSHRMTGDILQAVLEGGQPLVDWLVRREKNRDFWRTHFPRMAQRNIRLTEPWLRPGVSFPLGPVSDRHAIPDGMFWLEDVRVRVVETSQVEFALRELAPDSEEQEEMFPEHEGARQLGPGIIDEDEDELSEEGEDDDEAEERRNLKAQADSLLERTSDGKPETDEANPLGISCGPAWRLFTSFRSRLDIEFDVSAQVVGQVAKAPVCRYLMRRLGDSLGTACSSAIPEAIDALRVYLIAVLLFDGVSITSVRRSMENTWFSGRVPLGLDRQGNVVFLVAKSNR